MGEIRKVRLGDINGPYTDRFKEGIKINQKFHKERFIKYDWDGLKESFDKYGYDTDRFGLIMVTSCNTCDSDGKYEVRDGNHRLYILREMYGDEHFVLVNHVKKYDIIGKCMWCEKVKGLIKTTSGKLELTNIIVISMCFLLLYLKPTLIFMGVILGLIVISVTGVFDIKKETYNKHGHKYGGGIGKLINIVTNTPMAIIMISAIYYIWHLININIYGFMVIVGFTVIMGHLIRYYENKEKGDR
tara:strand:+ start:895 stop:1626 length:732 start_codon:yes stop_codon:yes gene_type:complete